jgi:Arc/MetJ family transcription regulator
MYNRYILVYMKTTLNTDEDLLQEAKRFTGIEEKTSLVRLGLQALIARESAKRLADLGGTESELDPVSRGRQR